MNLKRKKELASRTLGFGKERIVFVKSRLDDIKEAITKQDVRDLLNDKAIIIREIKGKKKKARKKSLSIGNIRKKVKKRKKEYIILTRKLRKYISDLKKQGKISKEEIQKIRKNIKNRTFKSKIHLKEHMGGTK